MVAAIHPAPRSLPELAEVTTVREFNRLYTTRLGLLRRRHLDTTFSLTEARILFEISRQPGCTASSLRKKLSLDAGYVSRLLSSLTKQQMLKQLTSSQDAREKQLHLTARGESAFAQIDQRAAEQIQALLAFFSPKDRKNFVASIDKVQQILSRRNTVHPRIEKITTFNQDVETLLSEYYESIQVVKRDSNAAIRKLLHDPASAMWIAYVDDTPLGCVILRPLPQIPLASECKRLYVRPKARGLGLANALMLQLEEHARQQGLAWVYLDTKSDLVAAIKLYRKLGYRACPRYNDNPQATLFLRKRL